VLPTKGAQSSKETRFVVILSSKLTFPFVYSATDEEFYSSLAQMAGDDDEDEDVIM